MEITMEQINAMRSPAMQGCFPRPEAQRPDGTLVCGLYYTPSEGARPQRYVTISPRGFIENDTAWYRTRREFVKQERF